MCKMKISIIYETLLLNVCGTETTEMCFHTRKYFICAIPLNIQLLLHLDVMIINVINNKFNVYTNFGSPYFLQQTLFSILFQVKLESQFKVILICSEF